MKKVILNMFAIAILCFGLSSGPAMADPIINLVGANAGSLGAWVPCTNTWGLCNGLLANGTTWGPPTQTLTGGTWSGYDTNRSVMVEDQVGIPNGYSYARTGFTAGAGGHIDPNIVHSFNLYNEINNPNVCCGVGSHSRADVWFRFEVQDPPPPVPNNSTGSNNPTGEERGQAGFSFKAENADLKARLERLEKLMLAKEALAQR